MARLEQSDKTLESVEGGVEDFILIFVKPVQYWKQSSPKLVTELGIVIEVKPVQPLKQFCPILVTELGIVIEVKSVQPEKQYPPKLVTELGIVVFLQPAIIVFEEVSIIALQFSLES